MTPGNKPQARPGQRLRAARTTLGITTRDVENLSRQIADFHRRSDFYISHSSLIEVENVDHTPSVHKLYSLSVIYRMSFIDLLSIYGIDLDQISRAQMSIQLPKTHLVKPIIYDPDRPMVYPLKFDPSTDLEKTNLLARMVEVWGDVPVAFARHFDVQKHAYGFIGLKDYTLYPMIRPGALVQIDDQDRRVVESDWENEFDRPIFFLQLRDEFACGWCQLEGKSLSVVPHPLSGVHIRTFAHPGEVEVVGRVTGIATTLARLSELGRQRL